MFSNTRQLSLNYFTNKFFMPLLSLAVVFSLGLVAIGSWNTWQISHSFNLKITPELELQRLSDEIIYLDEVLTMSARMAAATGDLQWENRYRIFEPKLERVIKKTIAIAPEAYAKNAIQTDIANTKLVAMENQAFRLISEQKPAEGLAILFSKEYENQKQIYSEGIQLTTTALQARVKSSLDFYAATLSCSSLFSLFSLLILMISWGTILGLVYRYINYRKRAEQKLLETQLTLEITNDSLAKSELALRQKAEALEKAMQDLKRSQTQMIQNGKMSSLGLLVAGIAHEINNPVNFIHGNVQHMESYINQLFDFVNLYPKYYPEPVPEIRSALDSIDIDFLRQDSLDILKSIRVGSKRIHQIVLLLRNFSRIDKVDFKPVDLHEGLDTTLLILEHYLKSKSELTQVEIIKDYGDLPPVECHSGALNQVFMNILTNAVDAIEMKPKATNLRQEETPNSSQGGQIRIRTSLFDLNWVEICIEDNGMGMPQSVIDKMFDPFFTTKPVGKGTGMGMSIAYQIIVEQHGGTIECCSEPNQGAQFKIKIPLQHSTDSLRTNSSSHLRILP
jgi:signal transduction histidine kinase